jgi:hypothetical protein
MQTESERRNTAIKDIVVGALWCIGGIAVTAYTYQQAQQQGGGSYFVAWGAVLFGGFQFLKGLVLLFMWAVGRGRHPAEKEN